MYKYMVLYIVHTQYVWMPGCWMSIILFEYFSPTLLACFYIKAILFLFSLLSVHNVSMCALQLRHTHNFIIHKTTVGIYIVSLPQFF